MNASIETVILQNVEVQQNGIIRNSKGRIIARLVDDVDFNGEHIKDLPIENKSIRIPVTDNDIEELRDGGSFDWSFPVEGSADSEWIDVELVNDNDEPL